MKSFKKSRDLWLKNGFANNFPHICVENVRCMYIGNRLMMDETVGVSTGE